MCRQGSLLVIIHVQIESFVDPVVMYNDSLEQ